MKTLSAVGGLLLSLSIAFPQVNTSFLTGTPATPLLTPLEIQAQKIANQNARAAGALLDQQIEANRLALEQQRREMAVPKQIASAPVASAAPLAFYVKLSVTAPDEQRDTLVSAITQTLRRFPDVRLVNADPTFGLSIECVPVPNAPVLACSSSITRPFNAELWRTIIVPQNETGWKVFASTMESANQNIFQTVRAVGFDRMRSLADEVTDTFNSRFLEVGRQAVATYERSRAAQ